jgi:hypothetical protein
MQIKINYANDDYILINLFDNQTVEKWFNHIYTKKYLYEQAIEQTPPSKIEIDMPYHWNKIKDTTEYVNKLGFYLDFDLSEEFDYKQSTLNKLHRFFTYNMLWYDHKETTVNPFNSYFKLDKMTRNEWHSILDVINQAVHNLENVAASTKNSIDFVPPVCSLHFRPSADINLDTTWIQFDEIDLKENYEYFNKVHTYPNLVMLDRSILGKCVLQSFSDDDILDADDCTGRLGSHGGFIVDTDTRRHEVYQSSKFKDWVASFNLDPASLPYEFPIGYVAESTFDINNHTFQDNFLNLELLS